MQVVVKTWAVADMRAVVMQRLHIGDERPLDLRPALVAFVVERPRLSAVSTHETNWAG